MDLQTQTVIVANLIRNDESEIASITSSLEVAHHDAGDDPIEHLRSDLHALEQGIEGLRIKQDSLNDRRGSHAGLSG
jgi:hypothetical protein